MTANVFRFDVDVPGDVSALASVIETTGPATIRRLAILMKVGGEYTDGARERAKAAVDQLLDKHDLSSRTEMITVIGCEGASTPCGFALIEDDAAVADGPPRLAFGLARALPPDESEFDKPDFADKVAAVVKKAMDDAQLHPSEVVTVMVNVPQPTTGDARVRGRKARAVAALGAGVPLGEIKRTEITHESIVERGDLYTRRVQTFIGPTIQNIEVIVIGNRAGAGGQLISCATVTQDLLDVRSLKQMLVRAGMELDADGELADPGRVVATILKVRTGPNGVVLGAPTMIYNSETPPEKHIRAAASGAAGSVLQTTRIFSTADPVQQAPLGGGHVCCIIRAN